LTSLPENSPGGLRGWSLVGRELLIAALKSAAACKIERCSEPDDRGNEHALKGDDGDEVEA
jgi:hypothetical protein